MRGRRRRRTLRGMRLRTQLSASAALIVVSASLAACGGGTDDSKRAATHNPGDAARAVVTKYEKALEAGRVEEGCRLLTKKSLESIGGLAVCRRAQGRFQPALEGGRFTEVTENGKGKWKVVVKSPQVNRTYQLAEEDGALRIVYGLDGIA
jgi:hypothetical protein